MSVSQPPPLRRAPSSSSPPTTATETPNLDIVAQIQHANARLAATAAAAARSRSREDQRRQHSSSSSSSADVSLHTERPPVVPFPSAPPPSSVQSRQGRLSTHRDASPLPQPLPPRLSSPSPQLLRPPPLQSRDGAAQFSLSPPQSVTATATPSTSSPATSREGSSDAPPHHIGSLRPSVAQVQPFAAKQSMEYASSVPPSHAASAPPPSQPLSSSTAQLSTRVRPTTDYVDMSPSPDAKGSPASRFRDTEGNPEARTQPARGGAHEDTANTSTAASPPHAVVEQLWQTQQQLEEVQRLYSYEKRAHLQQRTRQLKDEAQRRQGRDGSEDAVAQAAQLVADFESFLHQRDETNAAQLQSVLRRVSAEWERGAAALEETRASCADALVQQLRTSCAEQQDRLTRVMHAQLLQSAQQTVEAEGQQFQTIAHAVEEQVAVFKEEYRAMVEQDMTERQRLLDAQAARREEQWLRLLKDEHARVIAAGEAATREADRRQRETLQLAMRDMTQLRESLLHDAAQRQAEAGRLHVEAYASFAETHAAAARDAAAYVHHVQLACADVVRRLHDEVRRAVAAKQAAELAAGEAALHMQEKLAEQRQTLEAEFAVRWEKQSAEVQERHRANLTQLTLANEEKFRKLQRSCEKREAARTAAYEGELADLREQLEHHRLTQESRADAAHDALTAAVHRLEEEKESLWQEVVTLKAQLRQAAAAHEVALQDVRSKEEQRFASHLQELDANYALALEKHKQRVDINRSETLEDGSDNSGTTSTTTAGAAVATSVHALKRVAALEEEMQSLQRQHAVALQDAVDRTTELWATRLQDAQHRQMEERDIVEGQHRQLRDTLLQEVRQREEAVESRLSAQRAAHRQELEDAILAEKHAAQLALEQLRRSFDAERHDLTADLRAQVQRREDAVAEREEKVTAAEQLWPRRRAEEREALLRTLRETVVAEVSEQQRVLKAQEAQLHAAQEAFAQQQLADGQATRTAIRDEAAAHYHRQLQEAQQQWVEATLHDARQRYTAWQDARASELRTLRAMHQEEVDQMRQQYERQLQQLRTAQEERRVKFEEEMRAREVAWAAEQAASLERYEKAAEERLHEVLVREKEIWAAAQAQRAQDAAAGLESVAQRAASVLAATEDDRSRMENELRDVYVAVIQEHEVHTAHVQTELRAQHEQTLVALREEFEARLRQQARQLQDEFAQVTQQREAHLSKVMQSHEAEVAAMRAEHAKQLADQRTAHHNALLQAHEQAAAAQRTHAALMETTQNETAALHQRQLAELQQRCDAQAAQLTRLDAESRTQAARIREEQQAQLRQEYEESLTSLREALDARNQAFATLQASVYEQVHCEAAKAQTKMEAAYVRFTEEQEAAAASRWAAQEAQQTAQQREQQQRLAQLQQQHEAALAALATKLRAEHSASLKKLKASYEAQQQEWQRLAESAQAERAEAEARLKEMAAQLAQVPLMQAQQQATAYRALDATYADLLEKAVSQLQAEREDVAQRALEEAEQHFVSAMRRAERGRGERRQSESAVKPQNNSPAAPTVVAMPPPSSLSLFSTPAPVSAPQRTPAHPFAFSRDEATPLMASWLMTRNVVTPHVSRTPHTAASPLPISPAAPVEPAEFAGASHGSSPSLALPALQQDHHQQQQWQQRNQQQQQQQHRLQQLWDVLEVPLNDRHAFLDYVDSLRDATPAEQQEAWDSEVRRLEAQLPLLEALTRREYVERQLRALRRALPLSSKPVNDATSASGGKQKKRDVLGEKSDPLRRDVEEEEQEEEEDNGARETDSRTPSSKAASAAAEVTRLAGELQKLTTQLRHDVTAHESQFGQLFCYNGRRVMETLGN